ncbi:penicillin-binding protein 1A [Candidatus Phycorickettsia trachydisci]|uniref:Penicillin-binding protein 1A n=1 Tax=Candidatus Phycorickettsia trachydisci TaxID=2115978 RepID=A0A2P1P985_9RICK|nr:PBP1A family penicillin-binding protein [Candidatus Phycorickettsia trachydisci]AVP87824.1 penicillin-binding protein 1A [Candidatus Phycorickettsia trachydisci]
MIKRIFQVLFFLSVCALGAAYLIFDHFSKNLPSYAELANYNPPSVTRIYSSDGKLLQEYAKERRVFVPIENIPVSLVQAFIAAEDKNFYSHHGIDITSLIRAIINNCIHFIQNKRMEGASTISQQVVKMFFLSPERSLKRKIKEAILSYKISQVYSKDKILELYLNQTFFGKGAYGVASAAKQYFNKPLEELDLGESALLAGLPKYPSLFRSDQNYAKAKARRDYVLRRMEEDGYISHESATRATSLPIILSKPLDKDRFQADGYAEVVRKQVIDMLGYDTFYKEGLTIITPLHSEYQKQAEKSFIWGIKRYDQTKGFRGPIIHLENIDNWQNDLKNAKIPKLHDDKIAVVLKVSKDQIKVGTLDDKTWNLQIPKWTATHGLRTGDVIAVTINDHSCTLSQIPEVEGAVIMMDTNTGKVLAMVSGYDSNTSKFDRATQAQRQPGSLIKPFIYLSALEYGIEPNTIIEDKPIEIYQGPGLPIYSPQNYGKTFLGPITFRTALEKSRNTVTVQLAKMVGLGNIAEIIKRYGINDDPQKFYSMALGSLETTLSKITSAYGGIANGCHKIKTHFIELIKDKHGNIIYKRDNRHYKTSVDQMPQLSYDPEYINLSDDASCYQIASLLKGAMERGTGASARSLNKVIAGKTGTTNDSLDAWFVGFTPKIVIGTYVGFDHPKTLGAKATGAGVALPIFVDIFKNAFKDEPSLDFKVPDSISLEYVNPHTGQKEQTDSSILEAFKKNLFLDENNDPFQKLEPNQKELENFDIY